MDNQILLYNIKIVLFLFIICHKHKTTNLNQKTYNHVFHYCYKVVRMQKTLFDFIEECDELEEMQKIKVH